MGSITAFLAGAPTSEEGPKNAVFTRTSEGPKWTRESTTPTGEQLRAELAYIRGDGEGFWCLSDTLTLHDASGTIIRRPVTYRKSLPNEPLEWGKQYTFPLFEALLWPDGENIPETITFIINPTPP